jgi:hypothetical protein
MNQPPFWAVFLAVVPPLILGVWYQIRAIRISRYEGLSFFVAFLFGMTIEALALHTTNDYDYANLWLMFGKPPDWVPYTIGVCWASIMYVAMRTSDALGLPWWQRPLFDGAAAMTMDLLLDPVMSATKIVPNQMAHCIALPGKPIGGLSLWTWCVTPASHTAMWFTVPVPNFLGWCTVITLFSMMVRLGYRYGDPDKRTPLAQFVMLLVLAGVALGGCALLDDIEIKISTGPVWLAHTALAAVVAVPFVLVVVQARSLNFCNSFPAWRLAWPAYAYLTWGSLFFIKRIDADNWPGDALIMVATIVVGIFLLLLPYLGNITRRRAV